MLSKQDSEVVEHGLSDEVRKMAGGAHPAGQRRRTCRQREGIG